jgi:ADP-heptose:LPS heptosyltransferase
LESISPNELALELLNHCIRGSGWPEELAAALVDEALDEDEEYARRASRALFSVVVEKLADLFEPRLCNVYAQLFAGVIERCLPELKASELVSRYERVRCVRRVDFEPKNVFVLSRVTLGADVAVTSIVLDAARKRWPKAKLWFVGPKKSWELFEASVDVDWVPMAYGRSGLLRDRIAIYYELKNALEAPGALVLDPDSRLTQLGLLPVCDEDRHFVFESRSYGGDGMAALPELTRDWLHAVAGVEDAEPWLHPKYEFNFGSQPLTTLSLGVGENPAKRVPDPFEEQLVALLADKAPLVMVDAGAPESEEKTRAIQALERSGHGQERCGLHQGPFASFAAMIAASRLYVGYDSAGQHVAAALGIPLISIFGGAVNDRMRARWRPHSSGPAWVLNADEADFSKLISQIDRLLTEGHLHEITL